jgi:hypothetical protein
MFKAWAVLGLLFGAAILAGIGWFVLFIVSKLIFEEIVGGIIRKIREKRRAKKEKDHYVY